MKTRADVLINWLIRRDMAEILEIERHSFDFPWTEDDFLCSLRQRNVIGMVARHVNDVVGYMIYELHKDELKLVNFAVHQQYRRQGVGALMIQRLKDKLSQQRRKRIVLEAGECFLPFHLFLREQGFQAYSIMRGYFEDGTDAYAFRFSVCEEDAFWLSPYSTRICL